MSALREALEKYDKQLETVALSASSYKALRLVGDAAGAYAEGRPEWWCETHEGSGKKPDQCIYANFVDPYRSCRMVRVLICPVQVHLGEET